MTPDALKQRMKQFALHILQLADRLPATASGRTISNQLARSGTSVAANYRAACKGRSKAEFVAKLGIAEEEADETQFWLELIQEARLLPHTATAPPSSRGTRIDCPTYGFSKVSLRPMI